MIQKVVKMKDLAKKLDVSIVTVSKALNDKDGVSDELREKIKAVAIEMGYVVNRSAKSMKEGFSYNVGVIISEKFLKNNYSSHSFYLDCFNTISKELELKGYSAILHTLSKQDELNFVVPRIYKEKVVDGFIFIGEVLESYIDLFRKQDISYILFDFYTNKFESDCVVNDNYFSSFSITNFLIDKGYDDILFVGTLSATKSIQDRYLGFAKALISRGKRIDSFDVLEDRDEHGVFVDIILPPKLPQIFMCNCDQVAFNLIQKLATKNIRVPFDCGVVGFDNDLFATIMPPFLTTVQVNTLEMSKVCVKKIISKIHNKKKRIPEKIMFKGNLIIRDSVL